MDTAFRNLVRGAKLGILDAVHATSQRPAELLGIADRTGMLCTGYVADIVVLDQDLRPAKVLRRGEWVAEVGTATLST
jgi:N-acetylglucosamine-6-phosphate deacetylase